MVREGIAPAALTFAAVVGVAGWLEFRAMEDARRGILLEAAERTAGVIEVENASLIAAAKTLAELQSGSLFGRRVESLQIARTILERNPSITGSYVGYEPNADGQDEQSIGDPDLAGALGDGGRFLPYWKRDPGAPGGIRVEPLVDMEAPDSLYYREQKRRVIEEGKVEGLVTKPYEYQGVDLIEQTYPIVIDDRFVGIAGVDRSLDEVEAALSSAVARIEGDAFLATRGLFVAATTDDAIPASRRSAERLQTRRLADTPYAALFAELERDPRGTFVTEAMDPVLGETCFYAVTRVPTGGWLLVARTPRSALLAPVLSAVGTNAAVGAVGLAVVVGLLVRMARSLSRRIGSSLRAVEQVAEGDLSTRLDLSRASEDETGDLMRGIARMSEGLRDLVGRVRESSLRLESTAEEVSAGSRRQAEASSGFGASVTEIAASSREIAATAEGLKSAMERVDAAATDTAGLAGEGRRDLERMESSMRRLEEGTGSVGARLGAIDEKASGITTVVTTITKVADQTNLLSVNAALEAEKAGQFGVGFMVVAREIRRLADQTAEATLDIERMVRQMQEAVQAGVSEMDRFEARVRSGVEEASRLASQMGRIIERVNQGTGEVRQVRESMEGQAQGAGEILQSITSLSVGANSASESAEEFSRAATELQSALRTLRDGVERFRLEREERDAESSGKRR